MKYRTIKIRLDTYKRLKLLAVGRDEPMLDVVDHLVNQEEQRTQIDPVEPEKVPGHNRSSGVTTDTGAN